MRTPQQVFDKVVRHLAKQKRRSIDKNGFCVYRGPHNRRCAIGCLIPNRLYRKSMGSTGLSGAPAKAAGLTTEPLVELGLFLQRAHDQSGDANGLKAALVSTAAAFGLDDKLVSTIKKWS